jgi:hypothetical protein
MSFFSFLDWIFGGSFFDGYGASTNEDEKSDGGTTGSGGAGKPPTSG